MSENPADSRRYRLRKSQHLRLTAEFDSVYAVRQRQSDRFLLIFAKRNSLPWTRFGLSVSRKQGGAVKRQAIKRRLREAFRLVQHDLPVGLDLVLIPVQPAPANVADYADSLRQLCRRLNKRLAAAPTPVRETE